MVFQREFGMVFQRPTDAASMVFQRAITPYLSTQVWCFSGFFRAGMVFQRGKLELSTELFTKG